MNKAAILKILGFLAVPFLVMVIAIFFLYPYLNKDKYEDIVDANQSEYGMPITQADSSLMQGDSLLTKADSLMADSLQKIDSVDINSPEYLTDENERLQAKLDSIKVEFDKLKFERDQAQNKLGMIQNAELSSEEFLDRVKSLFNLEIDELSPILDKMSGKQLVRLYNNGSTMQREKMLRSLSSDKAAKLLTEIML